MKNLIFFLLILQSSNLAQAVGLGPGAFWQKIEIINCPSGYIHIPRNTVVGTNKDFCVAKYEMRNVGGVATSTPTGNPWTGSGVGGVTFARAKVYCNDLNTINGVTNKYALITNPEWMTIARNAELVDENWSPVGGVQTAGVGVMARGHSDNNPTNALASSTDDDPYFGTGNTAAQAGNSGWEQRRTHFLSNGEVIWDMAGNYWEYVDWEVAASDKATPSSGSTGNAVVDFNTLTLKISTSHVMKRVTWEQNFTSLNSTNGIGNYNPYTEPNTSNGLTRRGNRWNGGQSAGIFTLSFWPSSAYNGDGYHSFRCVYRP